MSIHLASSQSNKSPIAQMTCQTSSSVTNPSIRRYGDCALVEIIHLHDCLRGAIKALQHDVTELSQEFTSSSPTTTSNMTSSNIAPTNPLHDRTNNRVEDLERRVASRFQIIWSVFKAHSAAEDEFIWPALKEKLANNNNTYNNQSTSTSVTIESELNTEKVDRQQQPTIIEQEEYEEDHADEERMFMELDKLLSKLRDGLYKRKKPFLQQPPSNNITRTSSSSLSKTTTTSNNKKNNKFSNNSHCSNSNVNKEEVKQISQTLKDQTTMLSRHLLEHLDKEEIHCIPLVKQHLTHDEINDLVGRIMGQRSSDVMARILNMAVNNLPEEDQEEMVRYMKQAMVGTFFERWLSMGGWTSSEDLVKSSTTKQEEGIEERSNMKKQINILCKSAYNGDDDQNKKCSSTSLSNSVSSSTLEACTSETTIYVGQKRPFQEDEGEEGHGSSSSQEDLFCSTISSQCASSMTKKLSSPTSSSSSPFTQEQLEKLIRAIASNQELTPKQKNTTIQGLRDSVWKGRKKLKLMNNECNSSSTYSHNSRDGSDQQASAVELRDQLCNVDLSNRTCGSAVTIERYALEQKKRSRRTTPPTSYYKKNKNGQIELVYSSTSSRSFASADNSVVPLFSASELAPTYHDGAAGAVLGCPHYARSCKLRHPSSGRLYTCRLCCEQEREMPMKCKDSPMDRYAVTEVLCMRCNTLQPSGKNDCINPECDFGQQKKPLAKYHCKICNFYDDTPHKSIYHCPYCNVCRSGKGLGIDYRHCMRCNACVALNDDSHVCIPQRLQGNCPICHETMFESTEPLRGLKCGHVMHLSCFSLYMRGQAYTCPLCKKSVEDMKDYFDLLDSAVRMQPMPAAYAATHSSIYCQDCGKIGKVQYHFVGCKCAQCGSYNTREIERSEDEAYRER